MTEKVRFVYSSLFLFCFDSDRGEPPRYTALWSMKAPPHPPRKKSVYQDGRNLGILCTKILVIPLVLYIFRFIRPVDISHSLCVCTSFLSATLVAHRQPRLQQATNITTCPNRKTSSTKLWNEFWTWTNLALDWKTKLRILIGSWRLWNKEYNLIFSGIFLPFNCIYADLILIIKFV